jgi:hypothetical protein
MIVTRTYGALLMFATVAGFAACAVMATDAPAGDPSVDPAADPSSGAGPAGDGDASAVPNDHPMVSQAQSSRVFTKAAAAEFQIAYRDGRHRGPRTAKVEGPDWNVHTNAPVVAAAAVWGPSFYTESDTDQMFFGTNNSTSTGSSATATSLGARPGCSGAPTSSPSPRSTL